MGAAAGVPARGARAASAWIAACACIVTQALVWSAYWADGGKGLVGDESGYQARAVAIVHGGPWITGSIWPPLQSLWLAALYAITGIHILAAQIVQMAMFFGCAALLRTLWRRLGGSVRAANIAAALFLLNPANAAYATWLWPEVPHLLLVLVAFVLLLGPRPGSAQSAIAGAAVGLALLAKSLLTPFWPVFGIAFVDWRARSVRVSGVLLFATGIAVVTAPALVHGWRTWGRPMIADSSVYNVWVGLTDTERSDYIDDHGGEMLSAFLASGTTPQERNAAYLRKIGDLVGAQGIQRTLEQQASRQYFRLFSAKTPFASQLPGAACAGRLSAYHVGPVFGASLLALNDLFHALMLVAAAFGVACWRWRWSRGNVLMAAFIGYQLALMLIVHVKARFLFPMIPFLCGFAGSVLAVPAERRRGSVNPALVVTAPRLAIGLALAALLLFLAFAGPWLDHDCVAAASAAAN
ncbi:MAG: hypothetical protein U1F23_07760 [Lysobacterales bacterium]